MFDTSLQRSEVIAPHEPNDLWQVERAEAHARLVEAEAAALLQRQAEERLAAEAAEVPAIEQRRAAEARVAAEAEQVRAATRAAAATPIPTPVAPPPPMAEATRVSALVDARGWIQQAAAAAGWPGNLIAKVERVVMCESGGRTAAVAPAGYVGLMQVAPWLHGPVPADALGQLAQAYGVFLRQGWGAWPVCGRL